MHIHNISPTKANIIITVSLTRCPGRTLHNFFQWSWPQISRKCICDSRLLHRWLLECLVVLYIAINKKQETRNKCIIFPLEMCSNLSVISSTLKLVCKCHLPLWPLPPPPSSPPNGRQGERADSSELLSLPLQGGAKKRMTFQTTPTLNSIISKNRFSLLRKPQ